MPKNISAPSISVYCHGWVLQLQGGEEGGAGGDARDAAGGGAEAEGDAGVGRAQLLAPGVTRLQQIKQRRHLASLHYKQILRWCIGGLAQMAATYHTAGLSPHFSLPCKLQSPLSLFFLSSHSHRVPPSSLRCPPTETLEPPTDQDDFQMNPSGLHLQYSISFISFPPLVFIPRVLTFPLRPMNHFLPVVENRTEWGSLKKWQQG